MAKHLKLTVGPVPESGDGALVANFDVPTMDPQSPPYTIYTGTLSDGTPVKVEVVTGS